MLKECTEILVLKDAEFFNCSDDKDKWWNSTLCMEAEAYRYGVYLYLEAKSLKSALLANIGNQTPSESGSLTGTLLFGWKISCLPRMLRHSQTQRLLWQLYLLIQQIMYGGARKTSACARAYLRSAGIIWQACAHLAYLRSGRPARALKRVWRNFWGRQCRRPHASLGGAGPRRRRAAMWQWDISAAAVSSQLLG